MKTPKEKALASLAISAKKAKLCCESGYIRALTEVNELVSDFIREVLDKPPDESQGLALVGLATSTSGEVVIGEIGEAVGEAILKPRIIRVPAGGALGLGAVLLYSGVQLARVATETGTLEAATALGAAFARLGSRTKTRGGCEACIRRNVWGQDSKRVRQTKAGRFRQ